MENELHNLIREYEKTLYVEKQARYDLEFAQAAYETEKQRVLSELRSSGVIDGKNAETRATQEAVLLGATNSVQILDEYVQDARKELDTAEIERKVIEMKLSLEKAWLYSLSGQH